MKVNRENNNIINPLRGGFQSAGASGYGKPFIYAGGTGSRALSPLEEKTQAARKKAMKLVSDAFSGVKEADKMMEDQRDRFRELSDRTGSLNDQIKTLRENGISEEATEEERKAYDDSIKEYEKQLKAAKAEMQAIDRALRSSKIERLKSDPVGDAFEKGDKIMDAAVDAALGEMTSDAMDNIQKDLEEKQEQAEKIRKEQEELEERIEKTKEKKQEQEELIEEILESTSSGEASGMTVTEAQDRVKTMLSKLGLIEEEIKGAAIDELK